jgi:hypothetical protein
MDGFTLGWSYDMEVELRDLITIPRPRVRDVKVSNYRFSCLGSAGR